MPVINSTAKQVVAKLVYVGPGMGGKTTNLEQIYRRVNPATRGELVSLANEQERTLLFDLLPVNAGKIRGLTLKYQLLTVPGQTYYHAQRRAMLRQTDGIVFVADSYPDRMEANIEAMRDLYHNLAAHKIDPASIAMVLQYNKRDVPNATPVEELQQALNYDGLSAFLAVAKDGIGVFETLQEAMRLIEQKRLPR